MSDHKLIKRISGRGIWVCDECVPVLSVVSSTSSARSHGLPAASSLLHYIRKRKREEKQIEFGITHRSSQPAQPASQSLFVCCGPRRCHEATQKFLHFLVTRATTEREGGFQASHHTLSGLSSTSLPSIAAEAAWEEAVPSPAAEVPR